MIGLRSKSGEGGGRVSTFSSTFARSGTSSASPPLINIPTFDQVIQGEIAREPWVPSSFLDFLKTELNDENFYFFEEVEAFKASKGLSKKAPPESLLLLPQEVRANDSKFVTELVNTFVKENAPRQVNISDDQRTKLMDQVGQAVESNGYDPSIFEEAQLEVKRLMQMDSWPRFMKRALLENVSQEDSHFRLKMGILWSVLTLIALGLMLGFLVPRWYIFLLFLPILNAMQHIVTWKTRLCFQNAALGLRDKDGTVNGRVPVACPIVKMNQKKRAKRLGALVVALSLLFTGLSFALTYVIEAGQGKTLYG